MAHAIYGGSIRHGHGAEVGARKRLGRPEAKRVTKGAARLERANATDVPWEGCRSAEAHDIGVAKQAASMVQHELWRHVEREKVVCHETRQCKEEEPSRRHIAEAAAAATAVGRACKGRCRQGHDRMLEEYSKRCTPAWATANILCWLFEESSSLVGQAAPQKVGSAKPCACAECCAERQAMHQALLCACG